MPLYHTRVKIISAEQYLGEPVAGVCTDERCRFQADGPHVHTTGMKDACYMIRHGDYIIALPRMGHWGVMGAEAFEARYAAIVGEE